MTSLTENIRNDGFNDDLPLVQVDVKVVLAEQIPLTPKVVSRLLPSVNEKYPDLVRSDFSDGLPGLPVVNIPHGELDGMTFRSDELFCTIHRQMLAIRWEPNDIGRKKFYPGFDHLKEQLTWLYSTVERVLEVQLSPIVSNMCYRNFIMLEPEKDGLWFLDIFPLAQKASAMPITFDYLVKRDQWKDFRVKVDMAQTRNGDDGLVLFTGCGYRLEDQNWEYALTQCHEDLVAEFTNILSEEANKRWR